MILGVLQARMSSTRLPGKVLKPIMGRPMMSLHIERLRRGRWMDRLVIATSDQASDDPIVSWCAAEGIDCHRGPLDDVLTRVYDAAVTFGPTDHVVRLTTDCPLADWEINDLCIEMHLHGGADYTSNTVRRTYPDGLDIEVTTIDALRQAHHAAQPGPEREHVTPYIYRHPELFKIAQMVQTPDLAEVRWTVDTPADFKLVTAVFETMLPTNPRFLQADVLAHFSLPIPGPAKLVSLNTE